MYPTILTLLSSKYINGGVENLEINMLNKMEHTGVSSVTGFCSNYRINLGDASFSTESKPGRFWNMEGVNVLIVEDGSVCGIRDVYRRDS